MRIANAFPWLTFEKAVFERLTSLDMEKSQDQQRLNEFPIRRRLRWIFIIVISAALVYKHTPSIYITDSDMPSAYALCTPLNSVYTVDNFDSKVDCILVDGPTIIATGSEGAQ